eukprot:tig00020904_g15290.t1
MYARQRLERVDGSQLVGGAEPASAQDQERVPRGSRARLGAPPLIYRMAAAIGTHQSRSTTAAPIGGCHADADASDPQPPADFERVVLFTLALLPNGVDVDRPAAAAAGEAEAPVSLDRERLAVPGAPEGLGLRAVRVGGARRPALLSDGAERLVADLLEAGIRVESATLRTPRRGAAARLCLTLRPTPNVDAPAARAALEGALRCPPEHVELWAERAGGYWEGSLACLSCVPPSAEGGTQAEELEELACVASPLLGSALRLSALLLQPELGVSLELRRGTRPSKRTGRALYDLLLHPELGGSGPTERPYLSLSARGPLSPEILLQHPLWRSRIGAPVPRPASVPSHSKPVLPPLEFPTGPSAPTATPAPLAVPPELQPIRAVVIASAVPLEGFSPPSGGIEVLLEPCALPDGSRGIQALSAGRRRPVASIPYPAAASLLPLLDAGGSLAGRLTAPESPTPIETPALSESPTPLRFAAYLRGSTTLLNLAREATASSCTPGSGVYLWASEGPEAWSSSLSFDPSSLLARTEGGVEGAPASIRTLSAPADRSGSRTPYEAEVYASNRRVGRLDAHSLGRLAPVAAAGLTVDAAFGLPPPGRPLWRSWPLLVTVRGLATPDLLLRGPAPALPPPPPGSVLESPGSESGDQDPVIAPFAFYSPGADRDKWPVHMIMEQRWCPPEEYRAVPLAAGSSSSRSRSRSARNVAETVARAAGLMRPGGVPAVYQVGVRHPLGFRPIYVGRSSDDVTNRIWKHLKSGGNRGVKAFLSAGWSVLVRAASVEGITDAENRQLSLIEVEAVLLEEAGGPLRPDGYQCNLKKGDSGREEEDGKTGRRGREEEERAD